MLAPGNAVFSLFSGVRTLSGSATAAQSFDKTYIDVDGPVVRIIDLDRFGGPPQGQEVPARKPFSVEAADVGQVFAVALDDETPPNIYAAATSVYGLPIVVPDF